MRESAYVAVGRAGISLLDCMAGLIGGESGVDLEGNKGEFYCPEAIFEEISERQVRIRGILLDSDPDFPVHPFTSSLPTVSGSGSCMNNWATGFHSFGPQLRESTLEAVRRQTEASSAMSSLHFVHSLGGGCGSGVLSRLISYIKDEFPSLSIGAITILPSELVSDTVVESYNAVLGLGKLYESADGVLLLDSAALHRVISVRYNIKEPNFGDLNGIAARYASTAVGSWIYRSEMRWTYEKLLASLVPFPSTKFLELSFAPLTCRCSCNPRRSLPEQIFHLFQREFASCRYEAPLNPSDRYLSAMVIYRGDTDVVGMEQSPMEKYATEWAFPWSGESIRMDKWEKAPFGLKFGIGLIGNHSAVCGQFQRIRTMEQAMRSRNAFLHWYTDAGMDIGELDEAERQTDSLISHYQFPV